MVEIEPQRPWYAKRSSLADNTKLRTRSKHLEVEQDMHCSWTSIKVTKSSKCIADFSHYPDPSLRQSRSALHKQSGDSRYRCRERMTNQWVLNGKTRKMTAKIHRCYSAPANKKAEKRRQNLTAYNSSSSLPPECYTSASTPRHRCTSAPSRKKSNQARHYVAGRKFLPQSNTIKHDCISEHQSFSGKFSNALLTKSQEFDMESFSDVMSFPVDFIEQHFETLLINDNWSVVNERCRPQSCLPFSAREWTDADIFQNSKHCCAKFLSKRPCSSPSPRQRVKPELGPSQIRRGNVPKYVSFVAPMPVHLRPGTGKSSGYCSSGVSEVSEDLLVSTGTQEEVGDSGEETGSETGIDERSLGLDEECLPRAEESIDVASQEAMLSPRSLLSKSSLSQELDLEFDAEGGFVHAGSSEFARNHEAETEGEMVNGETQNDEASEKGEKNSNVDEGTDLNFEDTLKDITSEGASLLEDDFDQSLNNEMTTKADDFLEGVRDDNSGSNDDSDELKQTSNHQDSNDGLDLNLSGYDDIMDKDKDDNLQVTFSEPLTTDRRSSRKVDDNEDGGTDRGQPKSILKGNDIGKGKIYEFEVDQSIMKRMTSPVEETEKTPSKRVIDSKEADLRPQQRSNLNIRDYDKRAQAKKKERSDVDDAEKETNEDEMLPDPEFVSSSGAYKLRRPKPLHSIYSKRANLKPPSEKLHKRKGSNSATEEDDVMSAESSLLMEQILEQEKRLKEGMKPWLKGRLALSQQNSRFEIPMDVKLLETMTPMEYLANYCVISKRRKALYKHVFQKVDRDRDGAINFTELEKGLKDVHTDVLDSTHLGNIMQMVNIDKESNFDLKQFSAVAAFSERISCKYQLPMESLNDLDGQKEVIESADFFALNWKLDGIHVNPALKKILDSL